MQAHTVVPDRTLETAAGTIVDWRSAAEISPAPPADTLTWARACFQHAPAPMRAFLVVGWRVLLLDGPPRSDAEHVLGWPISSSRPNRTVLQRRSRLGLHSTLVFSQRGGIVTVATAISYTSRLGRFVWAPVAPVHRWGIRYALSHAAKVIAAPAE